MTIDRGQTIKPDGVVAGAAPPMQATLQVFQGDKPWRIL